MITLGEEFAIRLKSIMNEFGLSVPNMPIKQRQIAINFLRYCIEEINKEQRKWEEAETWE